MLDAILNPYVIFTFTNFRSWHHTYAYKNKVKRSNWLAITNNILAISTKNEKIINF
jgi:hypothetical protein